MRIAKVVHSFPVLKLSTTCKIGSTFLIVYCFILMCSEISAAINNRHKHLVKNYRNQNPHKSNNHHKYSANNNGNNQYNFKTKHHGLYPQKYNYYSSSSSFVSSPSDSAFSFNEIDQGPVKRIHYQHKLHFPHPKEVDIRINKIEKLLDKDSYDFRSQISKRFLSNFKLKTFFNYCRLTWSSRKLRLKQNCFYTCLLQVVKKNLLFLGSQPAIPPPPVHHHQSSDVVILEPFWGPRPSLNGIATTTTTKQVETVPSTTEITLHSTVIISSCTAKCLYIYLSSVE